MKTKVAIKSENITPFGGIFYVMDEFSHLELRPDTRIPSPDTILRGIKELAT